MHSTWFRSIFPGLLEFREIKEGTRNFLGEPILHNVWIIGSPILYFHFKTFMDRISSSFIGLQCIIHDSGVFLSEFWNFCKLKRGDLISGGKQFSRKSELFGRPFRIFNSGIFSLFIRFQCILDYSGVPFSEIGNFYKLMRQGLNFLKKIILKNVWIICSPLLCFNFKSFVEHNSSSFISFQCILHASGVLFSEFWNLQILKMRDLFPWGNQFCRNPEVFGHPFPYFNFKTFMDSHFFIIH